MEEMGKRKVVYGNDEARIETTVEYILCPPALPRSAPSSYNAWGLQLAGSTAPVIQSMSRAHGMQKYMYSRALVGR